MIAHVSAKGAEFPSTLGLWLVAGEGDKHPSDEDVNRLSEMINGTIIANLDRFHKTSRTLRRFLSHQDDSNWSLDAHLEALLRVTLNAIGATSVACYVFESGGHWELRLRSYRGSDCNWPAALTLSSSIPPDDWLAATALKAFDKSQMVLWPHPAEGGFEAAPIKIAALPIPIAPSGHTKPNWGVLLARKEVPAQEPQRETFTVDDFSTMRTICDRLALTFTMQDVNRSGDDLAEAGKALTHHSPPKPGPAARSRIVRRIPWDFYEAKSTLAALVNTLRATTRSSSVSMRVLVRTNLQTDNSLMSLTRFIAVPESRLDADHPEIPVTWEWSRKSAHAYVGWYGEEAYLPDRSRAPRAQGLPNLSETLMVENRPASGSELCLPVFVDGLIVGTLNLESPVVDAYSTQLGTIRGFAAVIGVAIDTSRARLAQHVVNDAYRRTIGPHEAQKIRDALNRLRDASRDQVTSDLVETLATLTGERTRSRSRSAEPFERVADIFREEAEEAGVEVASLVLSERVSVDGRPAAILRQVLQLMLENTYQHSSTGSRCLVDVQGGRLTLMGRKYYYLRLSNQGDKILAHELLMKAYRAPISTGGRLQLGCYIAGQLMASIGGSAHMSRVEQSGVESYLYWPT